jgi:hypothetical protein
LIIAMAQPTPLSTSIALVGQLTMQAPHSMHLSGDAIRAFFSPASKTA